MFIQQSDKENSVRHVVDLKYCMQRKNS